MKSFNSKWDLAINGAEPCFEVPLHVGRPNLGDKAEFIKLADSIFDRKWLSNGGPLVEYFEERLCEYLGVKHCIPICNGTVALELAIKALNLKGEVIVPSFTFIATVHALQWQGIRPVFTDIDPNTHNLDPSAVEANLSSQTSGILGVHTWGRPCAIDSLQALASQNNLQLLFDAAHAFGCSHGNTMIGNFGKCEVFSFHATKFFNTFEGGAIATNDDELAKKLRLMKNFGFDGPDNIIYLGVNGKMSEISAAMGLTGMESLDEFIHTNKMNYDCYRDCLADIAGLSILEYSKNQSSNFQYIVIEIDSEVYGKTRDETLLILQAENLLARRYFWPGCHRMEFYKSLNENIKFNLENTEAVSEKTLILPTGTSVSRHEIFQISEILRSLPKLEL